MRQDGLGKAGIVLYGYHTACEQTTLMSANNLNASLCLNGVFLQAKGISSQASATKFRA